MIKRLIIYILIFYVAILIREYFSKEWKYEEKVKGRTRKERKGK